MDENGQWLSIMEYCRERKKSISTVRRYIKSNLVKHKEVGGKYFVWYNGNFQRKDTFEEKLISLKMENSHLASTNYKLMNENLELKNLIANFDKDRQIKNQSFTSNSEISSRDLNSSNTHGNDLLKS